MTMFSNKEAIKDRIYALVPFPPAQKYSGDLRRESGLSFFQCYPALEELEAEGYIIGESNLTKESDLIPGCYPRYFY